MLLLLLLSTDEIDAIGTKRYESHSGGEREIQRTMLELLNQMDGFDALSEVKVSTCSGGSAASAAALFSSVRSRVRWRDPGSPVAASTPYTMQCKATCLLTIFGMVPNTVPKQ